MPLTPNAAAAVARSMVIGTVLCIVAVVVVWLVLNSASNLIAVRLELLEPTDGTSKLRLRIGPGGFRARHLSLAKKSRSIVSGFLVGLYPVDVAEVRVERCKTTLSWGLRRLLHALATGGERERLAPKLVVRARRVRVVLKGNDKDAWESQKEAIEAGFSSTNHFNANRLTELIDEKTAPPGPSNDNVPPSALNRFIDKIINSMEVHVEGFHINWASENYGVNSQQESARRTQDANRSSSAGSSSATTPACAAVAGEFKDWNMGIKMNHFSLVPSGPPTAETLGITPRIMRVNDFDAYLDPCSSATGSGRNQTTASGNRQPNSTLPSAGSGNVVMLDSSDEVDSDKDESTTAAARVVPPSAMESKEHNTILSADSVTGAILFPDVMCVLLATGRQPGGKGKLLGVHFDDMKGVVLQLEPFQVYGLLTDVLPVLALYGSYTEWCTSARLQWHKEALARDDAVPHNPEKLREYAEALGSPAVVGDNDTGTIPTPRDGTKLAKLDKNMTLVQIMLTRMRVRKWEVARPDHVSKWANLLLDAMDPFQGVSADELTTEGLVVEDVSDLADHGGGGTGDDGGTGGAAEAGDAEIFENIDRADAIGVGRRALCDLDHEALSVSSLNSEGKEPRYISLQTDSTEESARLEALLYTAAQVGGGFLAITTGIKVLVVLIFHSYFMTFHSYFMNE